VRHKKLDGGEFATSASSDEPNSATEVSVARVVAEVVEGAVNLGLSPGKFLPDPIGGCTSSAARLSQASANYNLD